MKRVFLLVVCIQVLVSGELPPFSVEIENGNYFLMVNKSQLISPYSLGERAEIKGGNWGVRISNYGDKIEPIAGELWTEDKKKCIVGLHFSLTPPVEVLYQQNYNERVFFTKDVPVCGNECPIGRQELRIQCREVGTVYFRMVIRFLAHGEKFELAFMKNCVKKEIAGYGTDDWGHLFPPLGFLLWSSYTLLKNLELTFSVRKYILPKGIRKQIAKLAYYLNRSPNPEKFSKNPKDIALREARNEQVVFMILGFFLMLILSGDIKDKVAMGMFPKHFIFGVFVFLSGVLGLFLSTTHLKNKSVPFVSPMVYVYLGLFFLWHEQYSYFAWFMHTVFGYLLLLVGTLNGLRYIWPKLTLLYCMVAHFASFVFIGTDNGLVIYLQPKISPGHFVYFIFNFVLVYMVFLVIIAYFVKRWRANNKAPPHAKLSAFSVAGGEEAEEAGDNEDEDESYNSDHDF